MAASAINSRAACSSSCRVCLLILIRRGIFHQRRRHLHFALQQCRSTVAQRRMRAAQSLPQLGHLARMHIPRRAGAGGAQPLAQLAYLGVLIAQQPAHLGLQRARIHDLAQRGVGRQRQQIARHVEGPRPQRPLEALRLHLRRPLRSAPSATASTPSLTAW